MKERNGRKEGGKKKKGDFSFLHSYIWQRDQNRNNIHSKRRLDDGLLISIPLERCIGIERAANVQGPIPNQASDIAQKQGSIVQQSAHLQ